METMLSKPALYVDGVAFSAYFDGSIHCLWPPSTPLQAVMTIFFRVGQDFLKSFHFLKAVRSLIHFIFTAVFKVFDVARMANDEWFDQISRQKASQ